jgi:hypothetical protein
MFNSEIECSVCLSNFVEALGQGVEIFNAGETLHERQPRSDTNRRNTDAVRRVRREERRDSERGSNTINNTVMDIHHNGQQMNQIQSNSNTARPVGLFLSSSMVRNTDMTPFVPGEMHVIGSHQNMHSRNAGLGDLMNAFMGVRQGPGEDGVWNIGGGRSFEDLLHHIMMNDSSHAGVPPASERLIENLNRLEVTAETDLQELGECCISQDAFEIGETAICLPCKHSYKEESIVHWLKMHNTCPVCRIIIEENVQVQEPTLID